MLELEISVILFYRDDNDVVFIERYLFLLLFVYMIISFTSEANIGLGYVLLCITV